MQTQVTFRHLKSNPELQNAAKEAVSKFEKYFDNINHTDVIFSEDNVCIVEIFVQVHGSTLIAKESSEDYIKSLNEATDKMVRQLKKLKEKEKEAKTNGEKY